MTAADALIRDASAHRGELITRARRELGPWGDAAEDMVQDAYIHLIERIEAGEAPRSHRAWLHAVVRSRCAEERRRRAREHASDLGEAPSRTPGPDEAAVTAAEARWSLAQVAALPANERDAIVGQVAGLSGATTGEGYRSANAVYQALHRGRRRLRQARDAAWSILLPIPLRLWVSHARPALPLGSPSGGLGGLGGLGGAVTVAGISVLGLAGGVHLASTAHRRPEPSPLVRWAPAPVEPVAPLGASSAASASASPMQISVGAPSARARSGANGTALPFEATTDPAAASPDRDSAGEPGSSGTAPEGAGAQDAPVPDPAAASGPADIPPAGGGTESSGTSAAGAGAQDAPVPDPAAVGQADASSSVTTPSGP